MELEGVCSIPVSDLTSESLWQINDPDCVEGTLFHTHTATDAKCFRDEANCGSESDFNAKFADLIRRACFSTLLVTFLGLALIGIDNGNTDFLVRCLLFSIYHKFS